MSTREYPQGLFTLSTNGSGICHLVPAGERSEWYFEALRLRSSSGTWMKVVPRQIPALGGYVVLTLSS